MILSFFTRDELEQVGFEKFGANVQVSRFACIYDPQVVRIGDNVRIDDFCILSGGSGIEIGSYVHIAAYCALYASRGIRVGNFCGLSARTTIYTESDDYGGDSLAGPLVPQKYRSQKQSGAVVVESHAIVGVGSTIMPGIIIGEGAAIGAHSFVNRSCEPWFIYTGVPAKRMKERSRHVLELARKVESESGTSQ